MESPSLTATSSIEAELWSRELTHNDCCVLGKMNGINSPAPMILWVIVLTVFQAAAPQRATPRGPRPIPGQGDVPGPTQPPLPPEPPEGCESELF